MASPHANLVWAGLRCLDLRSADPHGTYPWCVRRDGADGPRAVVRRRRLSPVLLAGNFAGDVPG